MEEVKEEEKKIQELKEVKESVDKLKETEELEERRKSRRDKTMALLVAGLFGVILGVWWYERSNSSAATAAKPAGISETQTPAAGPPKNAPAKVAGAGGEASQTEASKMETPKPGHNGEITYTKTTEPMKKDPFIPLKPFQSDLQPPVMPKAPVTPSLSGGVAKKPEEEKRKMQLVGLMESNGRQTAIIQYNGSTQSYKTTEYINGYQITEIRDDSVVLQRGKDTIVLTLATKKA